MAKKNAATKPAKTFWLVLQPPHKPRVHEDGVDAERDFINRMNFLLEGLRRPPVKTHWQAMNAHSAFRKEFPEEIFSKGLEIREVDFTECQLAVMRTIALEEFEKGVQEGLASADED